MKCFAFTMAEILLSLTIIGVVAALTLPSLTGNVIFNGIYWTSSKTSTGSNWVISSLGELDDYSSADMKVWCVKR